MKRLFMLAALSALASARPEKYKEQEDFQFSRSSSDDGTKSGYYGAQRGNMGGNYERAHNMDSLAQNQMSGLVRQVQGELGDGADTRAGSVYSAANSRGTYGSGHFDLTNLAGRNFQEGTYNGNSQSQSLSQSASGHNSAGYTNSHSQGYSGTGHGGYQRAAVSDAHTQTDNLQSLDNLQTNNQYDYGRQASHSSGYQSNSGFREHSEYDRSNSNLQSGYGSNIHTRLISATPVRIVLTPGGRVAIPVAAQTYDSTHRLSAFDQNAISSDAEVLSHNNQAAVNSPSDAKRYESSYSYRKKWEKHDTIPTSGFVVIPTESTTPRTSELYEDSEARRLSNQYDARGFDSQSAHLGSASSRYNAVKSTSGQSRYQSNYNTQQRGDSSNSNLNAFTQSGYNAGTNHGASSDSSNAYTQAQYNAGSRYHGATLDSSSSGNTQAAYNAGSHTDLNSQVEDLNTKPKSYQSSYSYHKSWERQGDPYVIKPASNGHYDSLSSQRLTSSTSNQGQFATYHSGSNYGHDQADCDENGHIRVARSDNTDDEDMEQQNINYDDTQYSSQMVQNTWQNLEDLDKQSRSNWDQQDVGQESQNKWDNMEDSEQQIQGNWDQQSIGQTFQNHWDNLADLNQQSTSDLDQHDDGQLSQNTWDNTEDLGQDSMKNWGQLGHLASHSDNHETWDKLEDIKHQRQATNDNTQNLEQQVQNSFGEHAQASETEVTYKPQSHGRNTQNIHGFEGSRTDLQIGKGNGDELHTIQRPWDKSMDTYDPNETKVTTQQHISNNEEKTNNTELYLQQLHNNEGINKQESEEQNLYNNYDAQHKAFWEQMEQTYKNIENGNNNRSVHYDYSNGFANPSLFHGYQNTYPESRDVHGTQNWDTSRNPNSHTESNRKEYESETSSQVNEFSKAPITPLLNFWNKFDNIENEAGLSTHTQQTSGGEIYHAENNFTSIGSNQNNVIPVEYQLMHPQLRNDWKTDKNKTEEVRTAINTSITPEYQLIPQQVFQPVSPKSFKELSNDRDVTKDIQSASNEELERPQDIGRGDIGPEYISSKTDENQYELQNTSDKMTTHATQLTITNNDKQTDAFLAVLSLDQQEKKQISDSLINNTFISNETNSASSFIHKQNQSTLEYNNTETQTLNLTQKNTDIMYGIQNHHKNITNHFELHSGTKPQQNVDDFGQISQQNNKTEPQNKYFQMPNFEQENVNLAQHHFGQENVNIEPHHFGQENVNLQQHHFRQEIVNLEQHHFGQENVNLEPHHFVHENVNLEQHHFGQENVNLEPHHFGQENVNLEPHHFEQENVNLEQHHFRQENVNLEPHHFEQENVNLEQHHLRQENVNLEPHRFEQENVNLEPHNFEQENVNLEHQHLRQENVNLEPHHFEQENVNLEQHHFGQENVHDFGQDKENQMNIGNFRQEDLKHFTDHNENLEQQYLHTFDQENESQIKENFNLQQHVLPHVQNNAHVFEQQMQGFEQQDIPQIGEENVSEFGQQNEHLDQQHVHNFEQVNTQDFGQPYEQSNLQDFAMPTENMEDIRQFDTYNKQEYSINNLQPEIVVEPIIVQKQYKDVQSNKSESSKPYKLNPPVVPVTQKPGFWKSIGNKFSDAKSKVASWFKS